MSESPVIIDGLNAARREIKRTQEMFDLVHRKLDAIERQFDVLRWWALVIGPLLFVNFALGVAVSYFILR